MPCQNVRGLCWLIIMRILAHHATMSSSYPSKFLTINRSFLVFSSSDILFSQFLRYFNISMKSSSFSVSPKFLLSLLHSAIILRNAGRANTSQYHVFHFCLVFSVILRYVFVYEPTTISKSSIKTREDILYIFDIVKSFRYLDIKLKY